MPHDTEILNHSDKLRKERGKVMEKKETLHNSRLARVANW